MNNSIVLSKFQQLPEHLKIEVNDFIEFLLTKAKKGNEEDGTKPQFGSAKGLFTIHPDFDEPLEDFKDYR